MPRVKFGHELLMFKLLKSLGLLKLFNRFLYSFILFSSFWLYVVVISATLVLAIASTWTQNTTAAFNYGKANNVTVAGDAFSLASGFISSQLAGTAVTDVYTYDTTTDSSAADQVP